MSEKWKDIEEYEGIYQVSNLGKVRSKDRLVNRIVRGAFSEYMKRGSIMTPNKIGSNYLRVELSKDSKRKKYYIHRLVAQAFIPNPNNLPCVNHKDGNKLNNNVDNLEWCTYKDNNVHAKDTGLNKVQGESCHLSKLKENEVLDICDKLDNSDMNYRQIASIYSVTPENIMSIDKGKTWKSLTKREQTKVSRGFGND